MSNSSPFDMARALEADALNQLNGYVAEHEMTVLHDDGLYRHLRFRSPHTGIGWFELITWPGAITINGDLGTFAFRRQEDMLAFFRHPLGYVNAGYWAEKCVARGEDLQGFSADMLQKTITAEIEEEYADDPAKRERILAALDDEVFGVEDRDTAFEALGDFTGHEFTDLIGYDFDAYSHRFLLCLHAIVWGIHQYDEAKATADPAAAPAS
ncbi:hypothetical protein V6N00_13065 [Tersicoccus sp. MR15.9]|uniref:hypothetical protein n=1 Tax=Tersicoccus mangrovi TaxID=3121635 RepID=UPI002FE50127